MLTEIYAYILTIGLLKQKVYVKTRDLFSELYKIYVEFERNSENVELIVADGFIREKDLPNIVIILC